MDNLSIITNGHSRELKSFSELSESAREEFDYVIPEEFMEERFFYYRGSWYDVHEFQRVGKRSSARNPSVYGILVDDDSPFLNWDAVQTDSAFSAILIRWDYVQAGIGHEDYAYVIVARANW